MSYDSYTVPTLSLSGSRSRKNIPTKDVFQSRTYNTFQPSIVSLTSNAYLQRREENYGNKMPQSKTSLNYFNMPPRPAKVQNYNPPTMPKRQVKQISRNVYLSSEQESNIQRPYTNQIRQQYFEQVTANNQAVQRARQVLHSNSRGNLLRNPQSRVQVQSQVKRQTNNMQFKKIDINKALFDRKLAKLFQQIEFYDEQLSSLYTDEISSQIEELENIKEQNKQVHSKILRDLNSLIG